jgi:hypothetical protein
MKKITCLALIATMALMAGCNDFLDVNPKSEVTDEDMFDSAEGYEDALYGIYAALGNNTNLYGGKLSIYIPEILSHNHHSLTISGTNALAYLAAAKWDYTVLKTYLNPIWSNMYTAISYANNIVQHAEKDGDRFRYSRLYRGEALALRAFLHFELAKYYAVSFRSTSTASRGRAIPYVKAYSSKITPYSSLEGVFDQIICDLLEAEKYLAEDESLIALSRSNSNDGFTSCRTLHLNLYAVQGLLARVYYYMGDMGNAGKYAEKVIASGKFPLMDLSDFTNYDRGAINLKEALWGIYSLTFAKNCADAILGKGTDTGLGVTKSVVQNLYMNVTSPDGGLDRRLAWFDDVSSDHVSWACVKLVPDTYKLGDAEIRYSGPSVVGLNMVRVAEMYLIAAESLLGTNYTRAEKYMDDLAVSRGLPKYSERNEGLGVIITREVIFEEFHKEFYGEGQLWFQMKRLGKDIQTQDELLSGSDDRTYTVPIPLAEDEGRY